MFGICPNVDSCNDSNNIVNWFSRIECSKQYHENKAKIGIVHGFKLRYT